MYARNVEKNHKISKCYYLFEIPCKHVKIHSHDYLKLQECYLIFIIHYAICCNIYILYGNVTKFFSNSMEKRVIWLFYSSMQFGHTPPRDGMQFGHSNLYLFFWHAIFIHRIFLLYIRISYNSYIPIYINHTNNV